MSGRGAPRGQRQTVAGPRAVTNGRTSIRTVTSLDRDSYHKAHLAAEQLGVSVSGYLATLVRRDEVDTTGRPVWAQPAQGEGEALRLAI